MRNLAYLYYADYVGNSKDGQCLCDTKAESGDKAIQWYEQALDQERRPHELFYYAMLLYKKATDWYSKEPMKDRTAQREQSIAAFEEILAMLEGNCEGAESYYYRACYGLSRCITDIWRHNSVLLDEIHLLFGLEVHLFGDKNELNQRFLRACHCMEAVRQSEELPRVIEDEQHIPNGAGHFHSPRDIFYMFGRLFEGAFRFGFCQDRRMAYESVVRYYRYACLYDLKTRAPRSILFTHTYEALLTAFIWGREEERFYTAWDEYSQVVRLPEGFRLLCQVRWLILKDDYEQAGRLLDGYIQAGEFVQGLSAYKAGLLRDIVRAAREGTAHLEGAYRPYHMKQLGRLKGHDHRLKWD